MNTSNGYSRLTTNLITAALLTVFLTGFGVFASVQVDKRASSCSIAQNQQHSKGYCTVEQIVASMKNSNPTSVCKCQQTNVLAYK